MRTTWMIIGLATILIIACSEKSTPWIGTYALKITEESKEYYDMFMENNMLWPEITLNADGTFLIQKTEGNSKLTGTYTVKGNTLTITTKEVDGNPPEGKYAEAHDAEFKNNYQVLLMEGPDSEPWVRKEVNDALLKRMKTE